MQGAPIVCGTDFTQHAVDAATVAAALAQRMTTRLELVHVRPPLAFREILALEDVRTAEEIFREAERLRATGITVETHVLCGVPDEELVAFARKVDAKALVLGPLGHRSPVRWLLGSTADRTVQTATMPVVVTRGTDAFVEWSHSRRLLRVLVGVERSPASAGALRWANDFHARGLGEILVGHVVDRENSDTTAELATWAAGAGAPLPVPALRIVAQEGQEHISDRLLRLAAEERIDLLVVGIHRRGPIDRLRHGSVLRSIVHSAALAVVCVPVPDASIAETDS